MQIIETIDAFRQARATYNELGLVPTMGYLHQGHISLVHLARAACGAVAVSIFVNPTQFGPQEDLDRYPRDLEHDLQLLQSEHVDLVFLPSVAEIYPPDYATFVHVEKITDILEGHVRPGHFRGVATVVCKLLNIVQPTHAFFGQKDAQQTVVIKKLVRDLNIPVEIIVGPTIREPDGLAMSSRNTYLSPQERQAATVLHRALVQVQHHYWRGVRQAQILRHVLHNTLDVEPLAQTEYVSVAHPHTLQEIDEIGEQGALVSLAVRIGSTRLIDNVLLEGQ